MPGGLITPELLRAFLKYFREKQSPNVPPEILPVVVLDDNSKGPYPPCRIWQMGLSQGALGAGNYSYAGIRNGDPAGQAIHSAVVVDEIAVKNTTAAAGWWIGIMRGTGVIGLSSTPVRDCNEDKDEAASDDPMIGNVQFVGGGSVSALVASRFPGPERVNETTRINGPWILGPNSALLVSPGIDNQAMEFWARGRYYPSV